MRESWENELCRDEQWQGCGYEGQKSGERKVAARSGGGCDNRSVFVIVATGVVCNG